MLHFLFFLDNFYKNKLMVGGVIVFQKKFFILCYSFLWLFSASLQSIASVPLAEEIMHKTYQKEVEDDSYEKDLYQLDAKRSTFHDFAQKTLETVNQHKFLVLFSMGILFIPAVYAGGLSGKCYLQYINHSHSWFHRFTEDCIKEIKILSEQCSWWEKLTLQCY